MDKRINIVKDTWNEWSDTWYEKYRTEEKIAKIIENPKSVIHATTYSMIENTLPDLKGKRVCVPSSGDNHAVFAFHLLGAKVTSCDISERQQENAVDIANKYGWDIEFICDDTMSLSRIESDEYDLVYTSNGVHVWIDDLNSMYRNIHRILKGNGIYIMFDIHPFNRPFDRDDTDRITVVNSYDSTGPIGEVPMYHWRIQDIMNAVISSGLHIKRIEEMQAEPDPYWIDALDQDRNKLSKEELDKLYRWETNPMAAIPQWLSISAVKGI